MALRNTRALSLHGEDLSQPGSLVREFLWRSTVPAVCRPDVHTGIFVGQLAVSNLLGTQADPMGGAAGKVRVLVNRSSRYFISVTGQLAAGTTSGSTITVTLPIPPSGVLFLPGTFYAASAALVAADSSWPLPELTGAAKGTPPPQAGATTSLTFDLYTET